MKNVIITGATGMVGSVVLDNCLERNDINRVTVVTRRSTGIVHEKLIEVIHDNFLDFQNIQDYMKNQDVCIYCLGVYTGQFPAPEFRTMTVDYTQAFAEALGSYNEKTTFCFLSGQGADSAEKSRMMFARDKGAAENILLDLKFENTFIFRPGYIHPSRPRKDPNFSYVLMKILYTPFLSRIYPNIGLTSNDLGKVMVKIGLEGGSKSIYENRDIRRQS